MTELAHLNPFDVAEMNWATKDQAAKDLKKALTKKGATFFKDEWTLVREGKYPIHRVYVHGFWRLAFYRSTTYGKYANSRLRNPDTTRYSLSVELTYSGFDRKGFTSNLLVAVAVGEYGSADERMAKAREKAEALAANVFGITLPQYNLF